MACSDVKLVCCKLCHKQIASNLGECIHCGVCDPVPKPECCWWQRLLFILLLVFAIWATISDGPPTDRAGDCTTKRTRDAQNC